MPKQKNSTEENSPSSGAPRIFVVQKYLARSSFTIRLEIGGVLKSWAIPRGPSFDHTVKRMAFHTEDRALDDDDFENTTSGAGAVILWDRGTWTELENPPYAYELGKVVFDLRGFKMRGIWQLLRTKKGEWLLIKKPDAFAAEDAKVDIGQESILSGLTVEELAAGKTKSGEIVADLEKIRAPKKKVRAIDQSPMLAETAEEPFSKKGWIFELKYDGYRLVAARDQGTPRLLYRKGGDSTRVFPDICSAIDKLPYGHVVIDGEVVVLDNNARPSFQRLQKRVQLSRVQDIERAALEHPAVFYAFDLLAFEDYDLRALPLLVRKALLKKVLPKYGPLRFCDHVEERGLELFRQVEKLELEGVVAKKADSIYRAGRSADWLKVRVDQTGDFAVVGYALPKEEFRTGFSALHLAYFEDGKYIYNGRVGGGFAEKELRAIYERLQPSVVDTPMFEGSMPPGKAHVWVRPEFVVEVRYKEITNDQLLRQPVFLRLRDDKKPEDCARDFKADHAPVIESAAEPAPQPEQPKLSNQEKIFWPEDNLTKGDLINYYRDIAPWLLPYLKDRPLVLTRYPDGIHGKNFYQKDAPNYIPPWIRTEKIWADQDSREIDFFIVDDLDSLLFVANLASIPLHVWSSRMAQLERPDWCIIDLDPKKAPFSAVKTIALALRTLCEEIALPSFVKTSGSTGLHILLPLAGQCTYEQSRGLGELISRVIVEQLPDISTITRQVNARGDKVYLDYLQNGHGQTLVSPLCVRPLPTAPVSMILRWDEVEGLESPRQFTIKDAVARMSAMPEDPMLAILDTKVKLPLILKNLEKKMRAAKK